MKSITQIIRLWQIQRTLLRYHLLEIFIPIDSGLHPLVALSKINPWYRKGEKELSRGERLRLACQELGPFFIKFGQLLSTRRDILPDDIANELIKLQDQVPPFTHPDISTLVSDALGRPMEEIFTQVESLPLASASIAQVHGAVLPNERNVVLKILRPNIKKVIDRDLSLLKSLAKKASRYLAHGARLQLVVKEIEQTIYAELDFLKEAANMAQSRRNLAGVPYVKIPDVIWPLTRSDFLVMERIHGIPLNDINQLKENHVNLKKTAESLIRLFFLQVFEHGFFHADMHAGNVFLSKEPHSLHDIILVDFGIVGNLDTKDLTYLAQNLNAFLKGDYRRIAELHVESGWVPEDTRIDQLSGAIRTVCEPLLAQPLKDISFGQIMMGLLKTASEFNAHVQPQLILLQKTLINVEGLSRELDPSVKFFDIARESVENWVKKNSGIKGFINQMKIHGPQLATQLPAMPELLFKHLQTSLKEKNKPMLANKINSSYSFWTGVGITTLIGSVSLSSLLFIFPNEIAAMGYFSPSLTLLASAGLGIFGVSSLLLGRRKVNS
jgi:ubiquinone biosynthesis protein